MAKRAPQERWKADINERIMALKVSGELKPLRTKGLRNLGRKKLYANGNEWWLDFNRRSSSPEYLEWQKECKSLAHRFGLAPWIVELMCLLKGYDPIKDDSIVREAQWPRIRVVTDNTDPLFLRRLAYEAQQFGLVVVQQQGSAEMTMLNLGDTLQEALELPASSRPPMDVAFRIRIELPPGYPPEAARDLITKACGLERDLRKKLGYRDRERLRASSLVPMAEKLKVEKRHITSREMYPIIDDIYMDEDIDDFKEVLKEDEVRLKQIKSRRYHLRKRIVDRYKEE